MARIREQAIFSPLSPIFSPICGFIFRRSVVIFSPLYIAYSGFSSTLYI